MTRLIAVAALCLCACGSDEWRVEGRDQRRGHDRDTCDNLGGRWSTHYDINSWIAGFACTYGEPAKPQLVTGTVNDGLHFAVSIPRGSELLRIDVAYTKPGNQIVTKHVMPESMATP